MSSERQQREANINKYIRRISPFHCQTEPELGPVVGISNAAATRKTMNENLDATAQLFLLPPGAATMHGKTKKCAWLSISCSPWLDLLANQP